MSEEIKSFEELGVIPKLADVCIKLGWDRPTRIQAAVLPAALAGKDVVGLAETGSGKTAAFAIPVLQALLERPARLAALVIAPTRELVFQIAAQFEALGAGFGLTCAIVVGGVDSVAQAVALSKKPHVIIATPGRLVDHLENTRGFDLKKLQFLIFDEADRILDMDFEEAIKKILKEIPTERKTYLFSATMTTKVQKLQKCSLKNPIKIEVSSKYQTVETLEEFYIFIPFKFKMVYLMHILSDLSGNSFMIFCSTCKNVQRLSLILKQLGFSAIFLHGQMEQDSRTRALHKFRSEQSRILVSTDVASRGLDIPHVDVVINFDIPTQSKSYIHRVGRTARAGRSGKSITFVTQYDVEIFQRIEKLLGKTIAEYPIQENDAMVFLDRVNEAERLSKKELKDIELQGKNKNKIKILDDEEEGAEIRINVPIKRKQKFKNKKVK